MGLDTSRVTLRGGVRVRVRVGGSCGPWICAITGSSAWSLMKATHCRSRSAAASAAEGWVHGIR